ncbi:MAG: hypothetical protein K0M55_15920 [Rhizobium sp.]|nr:hypothetical protein [Rhizobium sp.]MBW8322943.1 hypothetical protein [Rhizobium sp.]MBW8447925.1 hypothetical protein [Arenimonas sp.]
MSITSADDRRTRYNPVVATTSFAADFPVFDNDDIKVYVDGVERDDFAVTATYAEGISNDATAVFAVGVTGVVDVVGYRDPKRTNRFQNGAPLPTRDFNLALDTVEGEVQEARRDIERALKVPFGSAGGNFLASNPGSFLILDSNGDVIGSDPPDGTGNMNTVIYDPLGVGADAFDLTNMHGHIDDSQLKPGAAVTNRTTETISPFDPAYGADGVGDDLPAIQAAFDAGSAGTKLVVLPHDMDAAGELTINENQTIFGRCGATIFQTARSNIGAFMTNLESSVSDVASIKSGMFVLNARISGSKLPGPARFVITSGTTTDIVLPVGAPAVDDFYTGELLQFETGAAAAGILRFVTNYVGATRTATLHAALGSAPSPGDTCIIGWNDNAFGGAGGISDAVFSGGDYSGYDTLDQVPAGSGGKGWGLDPGSNNILLWGSTFRPSGNHMTHAVFVQGLDGVWPNGSSKGATGIRLGGYHAEDCGSVLTIAGVDATKLPDGDFADSNVIAGFITYKNAGHNPYRIVGSDQQKSGIFNPIEAQNFQIYNVSGYNESTYPASIGYPTDSDKRVGYGLGGRVGALIWGHCRNGTIDGWKHKGDLDTIWRVQRGRALGDDASRTDGPTAGTVGNCYNNRFRNIEHFGLLSSVIAIDSVAGIRIPADQLTGELQCVVDDCTVICDANMSTFEGIIIDVTRRSDGKRVRGTPKQIILAGNTLDGFPERETIFRQGHSYTLGDDTVVRIVPPKKSGFVEFCVPNGSSGASNNFGKVHYCIQGAAVANPCYGTLLATGTTVLTDGTSDGTDVSWNVNAVVSDAIYIKNRLGTTRSIDVFFS